MTPENELSKRCPQVLSTSKTCPTCGKTYSRVSDMRQHQMTHTGERPFQCSQCKKRFQLKYDLKRHELNVCRITVPQTQNWSSELHEDKIAQDPKQGEVHGQLQTLPSDIRSHGKDCLVNQKQVEAASGEVVPLPTKQDLRPFNNKAQLGDIKEQSQQPRQGNQRGKKLESQKRHVNTNP